MKGGRLSLSLPLSLSVGVSLSSVPSRERERAVQRTLPFRFTPLPSPRPPSHESLAHHRRRHHSHHYHQQHRHHLVHPTTNRAWLSFLYSFYRSVLRHPLTRATLQLRFPTTGPGATRPVLSSPRLCHSTRGFSVPLYLRAPSPSSYPSLSRCLRRTRSRLASLFLSSKSPPTPRHGATPRLPPPHHHTPLLRTCAIPRPRAPRST